MSLADLGLQVGKLILDTSAGSTADYFIDKIKDAKKKSDLKSILITQIQEEEINFKSDYGLLNFDFSPLYEVIPSTLLDENSLRNIMSVNKETRDLESTKVLNKCNFATSATNKESKEYVYNIVLHCYQAMDAFFISLVPEEYKTLAKDIVDAINQNTEEVIKKAIGELGIQVKETTKKIEAMYEEIIKINQKDSLQNKELPAVKENLSKLDAMELTGDEEAIISLSALNSSTFYIKELAFKFLYGYKMKASTYSIFQSSRAIMHMADSKDKRWKLLNDFFELCTSYKQFDTNKDERRILFSSNIFDLITNDIIDGNNRIRLSVKSRPSQGKSTFLSLLYLYFLGLYFKGSFKYIPVYFNREKITDYPYKDKLEIFKRFMAESNALAELINKNNPTEKLHVCYILDGFNGCNYFENSFDDKVFEMYLEHEDKTPYPDNLYVLAIDMDNDHGELTESLIGNFKAASNVLYFRDIETNSLRADTAKNFIDSLSEILCLENSEIIAKNIRESGMEYVDMNLLARHGESFVKEKDFELIFGTYGRQSGVFDIAETKTISKCAYQIFVLKSQYNFLDDDLHISHSTYCTLCRQREVAMHYCAKYYFSEIKRLSKCTTEEVEEFSVLNHFYSHEQNVFLKKLRDRHEISPQVLKIFLDSHYEQLSDLGKSQMIYLFGHWKDSYGNRCIDCSNYYINPTEKGEGFKDFSVELANRSKLIIEAYDSLDLTQAYILELLKNPILRRINRAAHMLYYSDVHYRDAIKIYEDNSIFKGFDIYHTFLMLTDRISDQNYKKSMKLLDMFSLCDLLEHRFRQPVAITKNDKDEKMWSSFFYTDVYNDSLDMSPKQILTKYIETIENYKQKDLDDNIKIYFERCKKDAKDVLQFYDKKNPHINTKMFHQSNPYEKIRTIENENRKGWMINQAISPGSSPALFDEFSKRHSLETVEQHIYQSYLIGLLYLPVEYSPSQSESERFIGDYDKQTILNTLLIHDIGESQTGDWPAYFNNYNKIKQDENTFNKRLLIGGAYSETADLFEYLELWNNWVKIEQGQGGNINAAIAREIDRIQFLYRYYSLRRDGLLDDYEPERCIQIEEARKTISTGVGVKILRILIDENPHLVPNEKT